MRECFHSDQREREKIDVHKCFYLYCNVSQTVINLLRFYLTLACHTKTALKGIRYCYWVLVEKCTYIPVLQFQYIFISKKILLPP